MKTSAVAQPEMKRELGLLDSTMIVAGSMIGSGIFLVSSDIAKCNSLRMLEFQLERVNTNPVHFKKAIKMFEKL
jgi:hypothetical protein